jgi:hypothetical protein
MEDQTDPKAHEHWTDNADRPAVQKFPKRARDSIFLNRFFHATFKSFAERNEPQPRRAHARVFSENDTGAVGSIASLRRSAFNREFC